MKKPLLILLITLLSFVCDRIYKIISIQNKSQVNIVVVTSVDSSISDEQLFYGPKLSVDIDSVETLFSPIRYQKSFLLFFNHDSVYYNIKRREVSGIAKKSFLQKVLITEEENNKTFVFKLTQTK